MNDDLDRRTARGADRAGIRMRRGYWFIPKHVFGVPSDEFADSGCVDAHALTHYRDSVFARMDWERLARTPMKSAAAGRSSAWQVNR